MSEVETAAAASPKFFRYSRAVLLGLGLSTASLVVQLANGNAHIVDSAEGYADLFGRVAGPVILTVLISFVLNQFKTGILARKLVALGVVAAFVGGIIALVRSGPSHQEAIEQFLNANEASLASTLPKKLAPWLTWTSISHAGARQHFRYVVDTAAVDLTGDAFKAKAMPDLLKAICSNPESRRVGSLGVIFTYEYTDLAGKPFSEFDINPSTCP